MQSIPSTADRLPRAAVSAAVFRSGQVLLVRRANPPMEGLWSLPGGHIEPGEPAVEAALRELREETGIEARLAGVADMVDVIRHDDRGVLLFHRVIVVFCGLWISGEATAADDALAAQWLDPAEIGRLPATPGLQDVVRRAWSRVMSDAGLDRMQAGS